MNNKLQIDSLHRAQVATLDGENLIEYYLTNGEFLCEYYNPNTSEPPPAKNSILNRMQAGYSKPCIDSGDVHTYLSNIDAEISVQETRVETICSCGGSIVVCHVSSNSICSTCGNTERVLITLENRYDMLGRTLPCIYKRSNHFKNWLCKFPDIIPVHKARFTAMFRDSQTPFRKHCGKRKNYLSYAFTLHKMCEIAGLHMYKKHFPMLRSRVKLREQDAIWKSMCLELGWPFTASA